MGGFGSNVRISRFQHSIYREELCSGNVAVDVPVHLKTGTISFATDVYAFGNLLYVLYIRRSLFHGLRSSEIQKLERSENLPILPSCIPIELASLIEACWSPCAHDRPSFDVIVCKLERKTFKKTFC